MTTLVLFHALFYKDLAPHASQSSNWATCCEVLCYQLRALVTPSQYLVPSGMAVKVHCLTSNTQNMTPTIISDPSTLLLKSFS